MCFLLAKNATVSKEAPEALSGIDTVPLTIFPASLQVSGSARSFPENRCIEETRTGKSLRGIEDAEKDG